MIRVFRDNNIEKIVGVGGEGVCTGVLELFLN